MEIKSLEKTDFDTLFRAFGRAFADYEVQLNAEQLRAMLTRRGFDPALSFAAFDGAQIAAFTLNGIGNFNGVPTAYDTGTGTLKEYRGTGLGTEIFRHSMPHLRRAGVGQYLLRCCSTTPEPCPFTGIWGSRRSGSSTISAGRTRKSPTGAIRPACPTR